MSRTICVVNQKGGVGKTTTSVNLAAGLIGLGRRVLLLDMDPQGNATSGVGLGRQDVEDAQTYHLLIGEKNLCQVVTSSSSIKGLDVIPAGPDLVGAEIELIEVLNREFRLKEALHQVAGQYDYILIDSPPSLGLLTVNALVAADGFLVPLQCEYYALEGLSQLLHTAGVVRKTWNSQLQIEGILLTMFDTRNKLSHQVVQEIKTHFGDRVLSSIIPRNVRLSEAPSHGLSILDYDPKSLGAMKYRELTQEVDSRYFNENNKRGRGVSHGNNGNGRIGREGKVERELHG